jgi:agmatine/peptidylarginine deiminase
MIKPDFTKVTDLFLTYPFELDKHHHSFTDFYDELISLIPDSIHQFLIVNNNKALERLVKLFPNKNLDVVVIKQFYEIWLRDIMGFNCGDKIVKPIFKPDYYKDVYTKSYLEIVDKQVREIISKTINKEVIDIPLVWDGGNLITNGKVGFINDKIIKDNKGLSLAQIEEIINKHLDIEPIIIPTFKYDKLGHADGSISFINENTVCIASYPDDKFYNEDNNYINKLLKIVEEQGFNIVRTLEKPINGKSRQGKDFLFSATGCYVNNLILNDTLILPQFILIDEEESSYYNNANALIMSDQFSNVIQINCNLISKEGGVVRCLSFVN